MLRTAIIALLFLSAATAAYSQEPGQFYILGDIQSGRPLRRTIDFGLMYATREATQWGDARCGILAKPLYDVVKHISGNAQCGFFAEGGWGEHGTRYSAGVWAMDSNSIVDGGGTRLDLGIVMNRTYESPRRATPNSNYIGGEAGLIIWRIFRVSAGVAHRITGPSGPYGTIFTWNYGVQIPIPLFKIR